ncbi:MAG: hypothetical protein ABI402_21490 [Ferruginibacter sp.]
MTKTIIKMVIATILFSQNSSAQNVGIGTTTPLSTLHVYNGASGATPFTSSSLAVESGGYTYINILSPAANEGAVLFGQPGSAANGSVMYNNGGTPNGFQFRNNGNQTRMVINNAGNVGIGTTTPGNLLEIKNNGATTPGLRINNTTATWQLGVGINTANDALFGIYNSSAGNAFVINSSGNVGIGTTSPGNLLEIKNSGATAPGLRINNTTTTWQLGVGVITPNDALFGIYNSNAGNALVINSSGNVGIGTTTPNAPLSFRPILGKKITLYQGLTGDVGFAVAGNRLQIYSDNPNADVAIGYDAAGTFNERFAVKPNGALALSGNVGQSGQQLISGGGGLPASWVNRPTVLYFNKSGNIDLSGSALCADIGGVDGQSFSLGSNSLITYQFSIELYASNGAFGGYSFGGVSIQILNNVGTVVSQSSSSFDTNNFKSQNVQVVGIGDIAAGTYSVRARVVRHSTTDGTTYDNSGFFGTIAGCNDVPVNTGQLIIQVFPK